MPGLNGHSMNGANGHPSHGGKGDVAHMIDPHHKRASLRLIQRAVRNGWKIKDEWLEAVPREAVRLMLSSKDERTRLRAAELLQAMLRDSVSAAAMLDKIERLDGGEDTERATIRVQYADESSNRMGNLHAP